MVAHMREAMTNAMSGIARPSREKKSRKIFDPADHEAPSRKRKASSPTPPMLLSAHDQPNSVLKPLLLDAAPSSSSFSSSSQHPPSLSPSGGLVEPKREVVVEEVCMYCGRGVQKKNGKSDRLLSCKDCPTIVHPSCMDYTEELTRKIQTASWQCINCKTCTLCQDGHDDGVVLFCDACDLGYHMRCHRPPLTHEPAGRWECYQCNPNQPGSRNKSRSQSNDFYSENSYSVTSSRRSSANNNATANGFHSNAVAPVDVSKFLPLLPGASIGSVTSSSTPTSAGPDNWEDLPVDPSVPECSGWSAVEVMNHFLKMGFQAGHVAVFLNEEIDGKSLMMLQRRDVINNLGLKLGVALKVFRQVRRLQTKRYLLI